MNYNRKIIFDARWIGPHGIGRFAKEIYENNETLKPLKLSSNPASPFDPFKLSLHLAFNHNKDIFLTPGYNPPLFNFKNTIITVHDLNHIDVEHNSSFLKKLYYNLILKRACKKVPVILTVSEFTKQRIVEWAHIKPTKVYVVGNGVSKEFHRDVKPFIYSRPYFLIVGNRKKHKNELSSLKAFKLLKTNEYNVLITGNASPELMDYINNESLTDNVRFIGPQTDSELASLYKGATALVFPSLYEGFGLPVVEAMSCGTPVITSNVSSLPEISGNAAILVNPLNINEITNAMSSIINDNSLRNELIKKGYKVSEHYNWDMVRAKVNDAITIMYNK
ncbi:TPA: glycosyltransferase family 4 protein [Klebsiella quasipneumoniae subsp. similipneumoniae]|uniref:glycosyltransferase family 4 protein n=1 Tax=Klebsiella quasipneumoniae TaxID=1463165 RepID=UPI00236ED271|nr:glycosyltransferase family 1 protein [Klebsiella quasipneumoniae]EIY4988339.1 glycosyltransferase family 4 protein [Klebsiella quasipneumoniae]EIY5073683.1 glycosyltransferase family 4 protein [Klebsiella quasipneumoniae]MEB6597318.1 glycosyltransferase family 4 protein [Klebsiella quasipneumoniae]HCC2618130.1 glycosyltransferase family 4 protein [Klebsiella quasipneumoniae]HDK6111264.1 glycosyltransferase family 4 protein [Klebsiella quasipneumoniae]